MTMANPGLRHDATNLHFKLTLAILQRRRALAAHGTFHALGQIEGRSYEDRVDRAGCVIRCWSDGPIEVLSSPEPIPPRESTVIHGRRWDAYCYDDLGSLPDEAGVYVVYSGLWIVYIGESISLFKRLRQHGLEVVERVENNAPTLSHRDWGRIGDLRVKIRRDVRYGERLMREARLIRRLTPKFNSRGVRWGVG